MKKHKEYIALETQFKHLADNQVFDFEPSDWAALEARLDDDSYRRPLFAFLIFGLLSIFAASAWFILSDAQASEPALSSIQEHSLLTPKEQLSGNTALASIDKIELKDESKSVEKANQKDDNIIISGNQTQGVENSNRNTGQTQHKGLADTRTALSLGSDNIGSDNIGNDYIGTSRPEHKLNSEQTTTLSNTAQEMQAGYASNIPTDTEIDQSISESEPTRQASIAGFKKENAECDIEKESINFALLPSIIADLENDHSQLLVALSDKMSIDSTFLNRYIGPRFLINLNEGVEISQTPAGGMSDTDFNFGLRLGYLVSPKLVLTAGANYLSECYTAETQDYRPPAGFWRSTEGRAPEAILAVCDMIDLSIGASYHFREVNNSGLAAHINLNSNFMLREEYNYRFAKRSDDWTGIFEMESQTLLSNVELSSTYKFKLGERYFFDLGPYVKIPTRGVGHGNVHLSSIGFRVSASLIK